MYLILHIVHSTHHTVSSPTTKSITTGIIAKMASIDKKYLGDNRVLFDLELQL